jgi:nitrite reductase/ring-hydroxylating ferredoxin subunit
MMRRLRLCRLDEIPDGTARGFVVDDGSARGLDLFVYRKGDAAFAYRNQCPHQGTPLEMFPDRFMTADRRALLCTTHGAQFRPQDGHCFKGPCKGKRLAALNLLRDGDTLLIELPAA